MTEIQLGLVTQERGVLLELLVLKLDHKNLE